MTDIERSTAPFPFEQQTKHQQKEYCASAHLMKLQAQKMQALQNIGVEDDNDDFFLLSPEQLGREGRHYFFSPKSENDLFLMDVTDKPSETEIAERRQIKNEDEKAVCLTPLRDHLPSSLSPPPPPAPRMARHHRSKDLSFPAFISLPRNREPFTLSINESKHPTQNVVIGRAA
uniref:Uncharacterized protein n=1 Tax=Helicotheca tamesis TaxID=374047 RepID=A0A7S2H698_9STRA|eukprot:CAMPEP_0185723992 /NCGR_PEP_ID=MMETSP1171-20130828/626_1 /TAXON_ID=374046 /ORGANISM="Helicotheca tamensis, Strain CCMP826" /LENGTH=173 /DNA_ID=CAMNT_0028391763 /DNA_START=31 /DNA_END=552 /DNA_ORIENTATION=+